MNSKRNLVTREPDYQWTLGCIAQGQIEDEAMLQELLESNRARPNEQNEYGLSPFMYAASRASAAIVKVFLASGKVDPDLRDPGGRTPLSHVAGKKRGAILKILLESDKVDPDSRDNEGRTPLSYAMDMGYNTIPAEREAIVTMLLESDRVDPDSRDNKGRTPLSYAVDVGSDAIVEKLLSSSRVDPDSRDADGRTPLSYAAGKGCNTIVRMLLDNRHIDPDSRDTSGRTPLLWAAQNKPRDLTILRGLLETGKVNPASRDEQGHTALWWAIGNGCEELVILLIETGQVDIEAKEKSTGRTPLSHAARFGNEPIVKALLGVSNVDLNSKDNEGITPLMWAAEYGHSKVVDLLLGDDRLHQDLEEHNGLEIDARYLAHWERSCSQQHGKGCVPFPIEDRLPHQIPDWVIDTAEGCLVPGHSVSKYIALSYVWVATDTSTDGPTIQRLMLTQKNLARFQERGYLQGNMLTCLPQTVKDAIVLVGKYEERYLWVDCLCIVQDSERTRDQVDNMGEIYAGAYLTIVAATASGRLNTRKSIDSHIYSLDSTAERLYNQLVETKWATRGWTFQEQMLSKRVIIFLDGDVFWDCQRCIWNRDDLAPECTRSTSFIRPYYDTAQQIYTMPRPDLDIYIEMISLYNSRDLTYPQDALPAISGVLSTLERTFVSGFVSGLPCGFLDLALLWQTYSTASRRVAKEGGSIAPRRSLPSWSWCGWQCPVDPHNLRSRFDYFEPDYFGEHPTNPIPSTWKTHRLVQWYALSENMQHMSRIDESDSLFTRDESTLDVNAVPPSTQRSSRQRERTSSKERKHAGSVDANTTLGSIPLPLFDDHASRSVSQLRKDWPFLLCKTSTASLRIKAVLEGGHPPDAPLLYVGTPVFKLHRFAREPGYEEMCHIICLKDKRGNIAGVLRHMARDRAEPGDVIELIALSTGTIRSERLRNVGGDGGPLFKQKMKSNTDGKWSSDFLGE